MAAFMALPSFSSQSGQIQHRAAERVGGTELAIIRLGLDVVRGMAGYVLLSYHASILCNNC